MPKIDTFNKFLVSFGPVGGIIIQNPPRGPMSVAVSGEKKRFDAVLEAVRST